MADRWKKEGKTKIQKIEYLKNKKSFLDEIKNIFQFLKGYHLVGNKKLMKNGGHNMLNETILEMPYCL